MSSIHYFAGGNTARGFYTCFNDILPVDKRRRMFYIKGGPGVGKSTFMRKIAQAAEKKGIRVEIFHCSSDPDSLDGVALPDRGVALMDGTAPHVYDPIIPGARDTLISLGDFLDEERLRPVAEELKELQTQISGRFGRCYHYLAAAAEVWRAGKAGQESPEKERRLAAEWGEALPRRGGVGQLRRLFSTAYTPKGLLNLWEEPDGMKTYRVECPMGLYATGVLRRVSEQAISQGLSVVELLHPLEPEQLSQVLIPDHGLRFEAVALGFGGDALAAERAFDLEENKEQSFDRNAYELLNQRAVEQLKAAKALHDELEKPYVGNMDFSRWQDTLEGVLKALELQ
ncbi:MAG: hypothetical protein PHI98_06765 [Eubacteriales bacterium]|nr:hypothetical protein [Eubacteriales bacterium]